MVPHVFGWFTMTSVWFILFTQLEHARRDIHEVSDRNIPEWVFAAIIGTSLIFMNFAFVSCSAPNRHPTPSHPPSQSRNSSSRWRHPPHSSAWQTQIVFQRGALPLEPSQPDPG